MVTRLATIPAGDDGRMETLLSGEGHSVHLRNPPRAHELGPLTALVDEGLELAGIRTRESAQQIVARARANSGLSDAEAMELALRETASARVERAQRA